MEYFELKNFGKTKIFEIILIGINNIIDASYMFSGCKSLNSIDNISKWKTHNIINMSYIFSYCESLKSLQDISKWITNNVKNMSYMFWGCKSLNSLSDISEWNTDNLKDMSFMFEGCESLISLPDISKLNTDKVTNMSCMFSRCKSLNTFPDISKWRIKNVTDISHMFYECKSSNSLPDIYFYDQKKNTKNSKLKNIAFKFNLQSTKIQMMINELKIPYPDADDIPFIKIEDENYFENGKYIVNYINSLIEFDDNKYNICRQCKKEINKYFCKNCNKNVCENCTKNCISNNHTLVELKEYLTEFNKNKMNINLLISKYHKFSKEKHEIEEKPNGYSNDIILIEAILKQNYINYFHYINVKECFYYLRKKYRDKNDYITISYNIEKNMEKIRIFGENFVKNNKNFCHIMYGNEHYKLTENLEIFNYGNSTILEIKLIDINNIIDLSHMFEGCESLKSLSDISKWNINYISNMSCMFWGCESLISLPDISNWNTSNVLDMSYMFSGCKSLISLPDISNWNTNNAANMSYFFCRCKSLNSLPDISKWDTNNVTNMNYMFGGCSSLNSLPDISEWKTDKVTNMGSIFEGCESLKSLPDISKWNTNKVTNMSFIFYGCESLKFLPDLSKWNTNKVINMSYMFDGYISFNYLNDIPKFITKVEKDERDKLLNSIKYTYPNNDEIPIIKIKDQNHFKNGQDIENYIKSLVKFEDNIFNICRQCNNKINKFFCQNCNKNICNDCHTKCKLNNHKLIALKNYLEEVYHDIENINFLISTLFISPKEKKNSDGIKKKNKNNEISDKDGFEYNEGKVKEYTNDILLIKAIIDKNYIIIL